MGEGEGEREGERERKPGSEGVAGAGAGAGAGGRKQTSISCESSGSKPTQWFEKYRERAVVPVLRTLSSLS